MSEYASHHNSQSDCRCAWCRSPTLAHLPSPSFEPDPALCSGWIPMEEIPPPPPLKRQNADVYSPEPVAGSSPSTTASSVRPPPVGKKRKQSTASEKKTSIELMPPPKAPMKKKRRQAKVQLPMLVLPDALSEKWEIESGTFVIRPRSLTDFAELRTYPTSSDN